MTRWWMGRTAAAVTWILMLMVAATPAAPTDDEPRLDWKDGPMTAALGDVAEIALPAGYRFLDADGTRKLMELTQNPVSGSELGAIVPIQDDDEDSWLVIFEFNPVGYVKDDEKASLDADALLASIREGTEQANEERRKRGWAELNITGWQEKPFYNQETHNLEWAIRGESSGHQVVNYSTRILGRKGVMNADLVLSPEMLEGVAPSYKKLLGAMSFRQGERYAEFRPGDKLATYGLAALVAGGAGAVAAKTGLLAKFWKLLVAGAVAAAAAVRKVFAKLFGRRAPGDPAAPPESPPLG